MPKKRRFPLHPAGSIEQQLDMSEDPDSLRGDDFLHSHGLKYPPGDLEHNYRIDMSEEDREGDEMSGDEHSSGLQGEEVGQETLERAEGLPGDDTRLENDQARRRTS